MLLGILLRKWSKIKFYDILKIADGNKYNMFGNGPLESWCIMQHCYLYIIGGQIVFEIKNCLVRITESRLGENKPFLDTCSIALLSWPDALNFISILVYFRVVKNIPVENNVCKLLLSDTFTLFSLIRSL